MSSESIYIQFKSLMNSSQIFRIWVWISCMNFMYEFHVWISCMIFMYEFHVCIKLISCMYEIEFFRISFFPYPSWVQCTNPFLSMTTQTRLILIFIIFLAHSRPQQFLRKFFRFFLLSSFPYPSWVQRINLFLSKTTLSRLILILIIFWALSRPHQLVWFFRLNISPYPSQV